jgi:hypothetical protein
MRSWIIAALAAITLFYIAASLSAHAISTRTHAFRSAAITLKEQGYFPLCSLPFERLLPERCPLSGVTRKTFAHTEFFSV